MAQHEHAADVPQARFDRFGMVGIAILLAGGASLAVSVLNDPDQFFRAYFFGYMFWALLTFGCYSLTCLHHALRTKWMLPLLRIFEAGGGPRSILITAILFVPILFGMPVLYEWMRPNEVAADAIMQHKEPYLNYGFWLIRTALFFGILLLISSRFKALMKLQEETGDERYEQKRSEWGVAGIISFIIMMSFISTDWVMSMDTHWFSTIFGLLYTIFGALAALGLGAAILGTQFNRAPYNEFVNPKLTRDIGNMMLAVTMLWAYLSLSQYLIIYSGNIPEFTRFFVAREGLEPVSMAMILGQFFIPFLLLLAPRTKRDPRMFAFVGGFILVIRFIDMYWQITPFYGLPLIPTPMMALSYLGAFLAVGGVWLLLFSFNIKSAPLVPKVKKLEELKEMHAHA